MAGINPTKISFELDGGLRVDYDADNSFAVTITARDGDSEDTVPLQPVELDWLIQTLSAVNAIHKARLHENITRAQHSSEVPLP